MKYKIKVVWPDGEEEFVKLGATADGADATFVSEKKAKDFVEFMLAGMEGEVQSVNVVRSE